MVKINNKMKFLKTYNIFEKSTLTKLGVPNEVMKEIEYNYEISKDSKWIKLGYKKDLIVELKKDEISMFLEIGSEYIKVIVNLGNDEYYIQYFTYDDSGWGGYEIEERENKTRTQLLISVEPKNAIYKLNGEFQIRPKVQRQVQKEMKRFDQVTNEFKFYILYNFNNIIKKIYGKRQDVVMRTIANNISNFKNNASAEEILEFLKDNKKMAEKAREYEDAKSEEDLLKIKNLEKKYNSLPVIDEYLINFEEGYSKKYNNRLNIEELIETFGRMKIETSFMFYLFSGKLKDLTVQKIK